MGKHSKKEEPEKRIKKVNVDKENIVIPPLTTKQDTKDAGKRDSRLRIPRWLPKS